MIVFRLSKKMYQHDLSGKGAEIAGGRWNNKGTALLYAATNRALCMAEVLVHQPSGKMPEDFWLISIEVPDHPLFQRLDLTELPIGWDTLPHSLSSKSFGDTFVSEGKSLGLFVPSVVVKDEWNLLLNPRHPDFSRVKIVDSEPFAFDSRLFFK